uniref:Uncharacterized protein n=1 Tax=Arundo donax TaxID=35708 RepID=A0A0A9PX42_ARUDO
MRRSRRPPSSWWTARSAARGPASRCSYPAPSAPPTAGPPSPPPTCRWPAPWLPDCSGGGTPVTMVPARGIASSPRSKCFPWSLPGLGSHGQQPVQRLGVGGAPPSSREQSTGGRSSAVGLHWWKR